MMIANERALFTVLYARMLVARSYNVRQVVALPDEGYIDLLHYGPFGFQ